MTMPIVAEITNTDTGQSASAWAWTGYVPPITVQGNVYQRPGGESGSEITHIRGQVVECVAHFEYATQDAMLLAAATFETDFKMTTTVVDDPWGRSFKARIMNIRITPKRGRGTVPYDLQVVMDVENLEVE